MSGVGWGRRELSLQQIPRLARSATWLDEIERLRPGDPCDVIYDHRWRPATVITNGGSGYWLVEYDDVPPTATPKERTLARRCYAGRQRNCHIEHVRCRGDVRAWPGRGVS